MTPFIHELGTGRNLALRFVPRPLRKGPGFALNRRLGGSQNQCGQFKRRKSPLSLPGFEPWIFHPVAGYHTDYTVFGLFIVFQLAH